MNPMLRTLSAVLFVVAGSALVMAKPVAPGAKPSTSETPPRLDRYGDPLPAGAVARLGSLRLLHYGVQDFTYSPDGKRLISAGSDGFVRFWDPGTGKLIHATRLEGDVKTAGCVAISPDGTLYSEAAGATLYVWDTRSGKVLARLSGTSNQGVNYMYFSPDNKTLAVCTRTTHLALWDWKARKAREVDVPTQAARPPGVFFGGNSCQASFSPDSKLLATGTTGQDPLIIWDVPAGTILQRLDVNPVCSAFSPDNKLVAVTSGGAGAGRLKVYEVDSGKEVLQTALPGNVMNWWVIWSPDGKLIAPVDSTGIHLVDAHTGKVVRQLDGPAAAMQREVYFSPDSKYLAGMDQSAGRLRVWDVATGKEVHPELGRGGDIQAAAFSSDGRLFATTSWRDGAEIWEVATGRPVRMQSIPSNVRALAFLDKGRTLAAAAADSTVQTYDVVSGKLQHTISLNGLRKQVRLSSQLLALYPLPDDRRMITLEQSLTQPPSYQVSIWERSPDRLVVSHSFPGTPNTVYYWGNQYPQWAGSGDYLALHTAAGIEVVDGNTGAAHLRVKGSWGSPLSATPDGRFLAAPDYQPPQQVQFGRVMVIGGNIVPMDASKRITTTHKDNYVHLWETATGGEAAKLKTGPVESLALAADGRTLVTLDKQALRLWDLPTGKQRDQISFPSDLISTARVALVHGLYLSPDGRHAITTVHGGTALVWELPARPRSLPAPGQDKKDLLGLWRTLEHKDAAKAYAAAWKLVDTPESTVRLFQKHLHPVISDDAGRVQKLLRDLDDRRFRVREKATHDLTEIGSTIEAELRRKLMTHPSAEVERRLRAILTHTVARPPSPQTVAHLRALMVLERIGTPEARALLKTLSRGAASAPETREANAALQRLARK